MRLQITNLKAPWPFGAVAGDVLELPAVPVWAAGKCKHVADDTEPTIAFPQPEPARDLEAELAKALLDLAETAAALEGANLCILQLEQHSRDMQACVDAALAKSEELAAQIAKRAADDALLPVATADRSGEALPPADDTAKTGKAKK